MGSGLRPQSDDVHDFVMWMPQAEMTLLGESLTLIESIEIDVVN
jgi:hypothetical protein